MLIPLLMNVPGMLGRRGAAFGGSNWQDHVLARFKKINGQIAKAKREEVKLEVLAEKTERKIVAEKRQGKSVEGILSKYWEINQKIEAKRLEIYQLEVKYQALKFDDDEEDVLLLID